MAPPGVRTRVRLRVERGKRGEWDDEETTLFDGDEAPPTAWVATPLPRSGAFVVEYGHIMADHDHMLLQDQVRLVQGVVELHSTVRLEGHPLHSFASPLLQAGIVGRGLHRATNLLFKQAHEVAEIFQDPQMRRAFARAVRHPHLLTPVMQRSLLFLVLLSSIWVWLVGLTGLAIAAPAVSVSWNLAASLYFAALSTNLFVPIPVEPLVLAALGSLGTTAAIVFTAAGKAVGAWIIYTLGPALRKGMARLEQRSRVARAVVVRAQAFARRFGYLALGAMLAVPFSPFDIVPVYLFSTLGLRLGPFLAAVFLGFSARLLMVVVLGELFLGVKG